MNVLIILALSFILFSCVTRPESKVPCYAWTGGPEKMTDAELKTQFLDLKAKGIDIKSVKYPSQVEEWKQFRYDLITNLVNRLAAMVHAKHKEINAAVFPGPNSIARKIVRPEWNKWNLDAFYPMNYNDFYLQGTPWIGKTCKESTTLLENKKPVYSRLFICPAPEKKISEPDPENHGLLPEELEAAIRESVENGASGICLITPERMTSKDWMIFDKATYTSYTRE